MAVAQRDDGSYAIPAYGIFSVLHEQSDKVEQALLHALRQFRDEVCEQGFPVDTSDGATLPDAVGIDIGYLPDAIAAFVRESGSMKRNRYRGCRGRGTSVMQQARHTQIKKKSDRKPLSGVQWFGEVNHERRVLEITFDADYWKEFVHERWRTNQDSPGALAFFRPDTPKEHARISNHITNEQLVRDWQPGKGVVAKWVKTGENHFLDALAIAFVMLDMTSRRRKIVKKAGPPSTSAGPEGLLMPDGRPFFDTSGN